MKSNNSQVLSRIPDYLITESPKSNQNKELLENIIPTTVSVSAALLDKILQDLPSFNAWNDYNKFLPEFELDTVFGDLKDVFSVEEAHLLKGFFNFKGTRLDVDYVLKVLGYTASIYDASSLEGRYGLIDIINSLLDGEYSYLKVAYSNEQIEEIINSINLSRVKNTNFGIRLVDNNSPLIVNNNDPLLSVIYDPTDEIERINNLTPRRIVNSISITNSSSRFLEDLPEELIEVIRLALEIYNGHRDLESFIGKTADCDIDIIIDADLDSPNFIGLKTSEFSRILKLIVKNRLLLCINLGRFLVRLKALSTYDMDRVEVLDFYSDITVNPTDLYNNNDKLEVIKSLDYSAEISDSYDLSDSNILVNNHTPLLVDNNDPLIISNEFSKVWDQLSWERIFEPFDSVDRPITITNAPTPTPRKAYNFAPIKEVYQKVDNLSPKIINNISPELVKINISGIKYDLINNNDQVVIDNNSPITIGSSVVLDNRYYPLLVNNNDPITNMTWDSSDGVFVDIEINAIDDLPGLDYISDSLFEVTSLSQTYENNDDIEVENVEEVRYIDFTNDISDSVDRPHHVSTSPTHIYKKAYNFDRIPENTNPEFLPFLVDNNDPTQNVTFDQVAGSVIEMDIDTEDNVYRIDETSTKISGELTYSEDFSVTSRSTFLGYLQTAEFKSRLDDSIFETNFESSITDFSRLRVGQYVTKDPDPNQLMYSTKILNDNSLLLSSTNIN